MEVGFSGGKIRVCSYQIQSLPRTVESMRESVYKQNELNYIFSKVHTQTVFKANFPKMSNAGNWQTVSPNCI